MRGGESGGLSRRREVKCKTPLVVCSDALPWRGKVAAGVWAAPAAQLAERAAWSSGTFGMRLQAVNAAENAPRLWAPSVECAIPWTPGTGLAKQVHSSSFWLITAKVPARTQSAFIVNAVKLWAAYSGWLQRRICQAKDAKSYLVCPKLSQNWQRPRSKLRKWLSRASLLRKQVNRPGFSDLWARRHQLRGLSAAVSRCHGSLCHRRCLAAEATELSWRGYVRSGSFIYFDLSPLQVPPRSLSFSTEISIYSHLKYSWSQK